MKAVVPKAVAEAPDSQGVGVVVDKETGERGEEEEHHEEEEERHEEEEGNWAAQKERLMRREQEPENSQEEDEDSRERTDKNAHSRSTRPRHFLLLLLPIVRTRGAAVCGVYSSSRR